jgi:hypothetical protein
MCRRMLESVMSVWSPVVSSNAFLAGAEGPLVSVSVSVEPARLEELLDALAQLAFPINPQIYHDAAVVYRYADYHEESEPTTLVEFPAYEARLPEIRSVLAARGFPANAVEATRMLEEIHTDGRFEPAPPGSPYQFCMRRKHAVAA